MSQNARTDGSGRMVGAPDRELRCADGYRHLLLWPGEDADEWADLIAHHDCGPHRVARHQHLSVVSGGPRGGVR